MHVQTHRLPKLDLGLDPHPRKPQVSYRPWSHARRSPAARTGHWDARTPPPGACAQKATLGGAPDWAGRAFLRHMHNRPLTWFGWPTCSVSSGGS